MPRRVPVVSNVLDFDPSARDQQEKYLKDTVRLWQSRVLSAASILKDLLIEIPSDTRSTALVSAESGLVDAVVNLEIATEQLLANGN